VPQIVHLGARTGFVQELQMSHRQTWLILRDMVVGQPLSPAAGVEPGLFVGSRGCGGPSGLRSFNELHRGCARGVGQRAPVCRCATRRSKHEIALLGGRSGGGACGRPSV
jgi:hypothetical protein